jgi:asparagine synthase (glutamine-hydrolysing)
MCGISGVLTAGLEPVSGQILERMSAELIHRGPDDQGVFVGPGIGLAHRRLSIIDLSADARQPMSNEDGTLWLAANGEIYNYQELTRELVDRGHVFRSRCDSEVILHAYEEYGAGFLDRLNGMFAFVLWESGRRRLLAARDRIGIKPFYYVFDGKTFVFASEIKAILRHPEVRAEPDERTILDYLLFGNTFSDRTWYRGIRQLPPACTLTLEGGECSVEEYWRPRFGGAPPRKEATVAAELRELLSDAVRLHLRSDVPLGAHLSGGIDSSTVVALASRHLGAPLHTFSGAFDEGEAYDERRYIAVVSKAFGTVHHQVVPSAPELPAALPRLIWHLDEPIVGPGAFPQYQVCRLVADTGIKVVNGGQGGDEEFAGYPPYYSLAVRSILAGRNGSRPPLSEWLRLPEYAWRGRMLQNLSRRLHGTGAAPSFLRVSPAELNERAEERASASDALRGADPFTRKSWLDLRYYLPALLQVEDRTSMAWSIESRVPLLDYRVVEMAASFPSWIKVRRGRLKSILREAMRGVVPDEILRRTDKKGFPTPIGIWFAGPLREWLRDTLVRQPLRCERFVDRARVVGMVEEHASGAARHEFPLWSILNLELWMRGVESGWADLPR